MVNNKLKIFALILLISFIFLQGCGNNKQEVVRIGAVLPMTGPVAYLGQVLKEGHEWKIEELKNEGFNIDYIVEDSQSNPKEAVNAFNNLVNFKDVTIVITSLSSVSMSLKPLTEEKEILLWSVAAHPEITENSEFVLRHSNIAPDDARVLAEAMNKNDFQSVGILYQQDDWGILLKDKLKNRLSDEDKKVYSEPIDHTASDFRTQINKIMINEPDILLFLAAGPSSALLVKQAREMNYNGLIYSSVGLILTPNAADLAGDALIGTYYQTYEVNEKFNSDYQKRFSKEPSVFGYVGYTDIELIAYAIQETDSTDSREIVDFIKDLKSFKGKYEELEISEQGDMIVPSVVKLWEK